MTNQPYAQQLLDGIEERNDVIARQAARIEALEAALAIATGVLEHGLVTYTDIQWAKEKLKGPL